MRSDDDRFERDDLPRSSRQGRDDAYESDDYPDISKPRQQDGDLSTGDILLCVFCSGIACIIAIVRLIQGKPGAGKMLGLSLIFVFIWNIVRFMIEAAASR